MWVAKLLISPVKIKDFLPKHDQIWPKIGIFARPCWLIWCPVDGLVSGCGGAGCILQDTYLLYIFFCSGKFIQKVLWEVKLL